MTTLHDLPPREGSVRLDTDSADRVRVWLRGEWVEVGRLPELVARFPVEETRIARIVEYARVLRARRTA